VIIAQNYGYTLLCTGCQASIEMTRSQLADPYRSAEIRSNMRKAHSECDGFKNVSKAREAIKAKRRAARLALNGGQTQ
jgi:hypothetical protein